MRKVLFILSQLSDEDADWLANNGQRLSLPPGQVLIASGSRVDSVYIVIDGLLDVVAPDGKSLAELGCGEIIGEMSLVDPAPTPVDVKARVESLLLQLPNAVLRQKLKSDVPFAARFYHALSMFLADRLRTTTRNQRGTASANEQEGGARLDELNEDLLDNLHLAGARFTQLISKLGA